MADRQGRIEVSAQVDQSLQAALGGMSSSLRNVLEVTHSLSRSSFANVNAAKVLTNALHSASQSSSAYAKSTHNLARNQAVLAKHFRDTGIAAAELQRKMQGNTTATQQEKVAVDRLITSLKAQEAARKGIMQYSAQADLRAQSNALNTLATRYSMAGNRMSMALTLPIMSFMRSSFANYRRVETETIRTTKLISDSYTAAADVAGIAGAKLSADQLSYTRVINGTVRTLQTLEGAQKSLGKQLDAVALKYGVARELVQGLAGDFAELGIEEVDTLAGLTDLTASVEKLGNLDITASQEFIKSIFQTVMRIKRDRNEVQKTADGFIVYGDVIGEVRQQLALFNLIENKTQMSLKDIAKGFPEVTAAATSFGLSMTEATALVVPMVSAGMQVGASANSVKVSLQRVVDLTKENSQMIKTLKDNYKDFNVEAGVGIQTVQALADSYNSMKRGALAEQGTLEFFSRLFGVRQGPRMEVAIQNLAQFQEQLETLGTVENKLAKQLEGAVQQYATFEGLGKEYTGMTINKFEDLGEVVRLSQSDNKKVAKAFTAAREDIATFVKDEAKKGNDVLSKITTESGKALFVGAIGNVEAQRKFQQEVQASLQSVEVRYQRGREVIKSIGRQIVPILANILDAVLPILIKINEAFEKMPSWMKSFIGLGLIIMAAIGPVMKIVASMFQLKSAMMGIKASGGIFGKMKSATHEISAELLTASNAALRFKNRLTEVGGKFYLQATKKEIKDLERLINLQASGGSAKKIGRLERRLGIGGRGTDMSGLTPETQDALLRANEKDKSYVGGYRQASFRDPNFPATIMDATVAGKKIGEAFMGVLTAYGFDPRSVVRTVAQAATTATTTATAAGLRRVGGGTPPPPPPPPPPPSGPTPPSGGSGPRPSGGSPAPSGASPAPSTTGPVPAHSHPPAPTTVPVKIRPTTLPMVDPTIINNNIPTPASLIPPPAVPAIPEKKIKPDFLTGGAEQVYGGIEAIAKYTKKELIAMAKSLGIKKVSGLKVEDLRRTVLDAILAPKQAVEEATEKIADNAKKTVASTQTKAPPVKPTDVTKASDTGTNSVQASQVEKDAVAVKEQAKADGTATKKDVTAPVDPKAVKEKSSRGTKKVQQAQAEADAKAVDAQVKADSNTVKKIPTPSGTPLEGISPKAQKLASTVEQMQSNVQASLRVLTTPVDEIIDSLNLVKKTGTGSRGALILTKQKFFELAQALGIQLPPIFNKMGELVDANGQALAITRESLIKLIQSMTRTAVAPKILTNIAGQTILEFEGEVNRALALGKGAKKRFNFKGVTGKLQDSLSNAFGNIFSDAAGKVASATGAQKGDIDYTKIGYRDLDKKANLRNARKTVSMRDEDGNIKRVKVGTRDARATLESLIPQVGDSLQIGMKEFRQYVLTAKRIVDELMAGFEPGRAKRAVYRREMSSTEGYERTLKSGKSLDLMTEAQYEAFNKKRQKGIQAARDKIAERYEQELQAKRGSETPALIGQEDQAAYRESIRAADEAARNAGGRNKTLPKIISEKTQQFIFDIDTQIAKAVGSRLAELTKQFGSIQAIPKNVLESAKGAAIDRASRDLTQARNEQVSLIEFNTKSLKGKLDKLASRESELQAQIEKAKTFKGAALKTDEAKALFGSTRGKTDAERRDNYIKEKQILIDNLSIEGKTLKVIKEEIAANEKLLQLIDKRVSKLREEILLRRGGLPRFGTSKPSGFTPPTVEEFTEKPKSKTSGSVGYLPKPSIGVNESGQRIDAVSKAQDIIVTKAAEIPKNVLKAQEAVSKLQRELTTLESISKSLRNMSMKRGTFADDKEIRKFFNLTKSATTKELEELSTQIANKILEITTALEKAQAKLAKMAPDISPSMRPKSLSAAVPDGPTLLGNINTQLQSAMQIPTNVLDQFLQSLKVQGKGLAEIAQGVGLGAVDDLELLKQELAKIGMTIESAIATPAEALKQLQAVKFAKAGPVQEMFQRLVMYARDVATLGVQEAFDKTVERLNAAKAKAASSAGAEPSATARPKKTAKVERIGSFEIPLAELEKDGDVAYQQMLKLADYIKKYGITLTELNSLTGRQLQYLADTILGGTDRTKPVEGAERKLTDTKAKAIAIITKAIDDKLIADATTAAATPPPAKSRLRGTVVPSGEPAPAPVPTEAGKVLGGLSAVSIQNFATLAASVSSESAGYASALQRLINQAGLESEEVSVAIQKILEAFRVYLNNFSMTADQLSQARAIVDLIAKKGISGVNPFIKDLNNVYQSVISSSTTKPVTPPVPAPATPPAEPAKSRLRGTLVNPEGDFKLMAERIWQQTDKAHTLTLNQMKNLLAFLEKISASAKAPFINAEMQKMRPTMDLADDVFHLKTLIFDKIKEQEQILKNAATSVASVTTPPPATITPPVAPARPTGFDLPLQNWISAIPKAMDPEMAGRLMRQFARSEAKRQDMFVPPAPIAPPVSATRSLQDRIDAQLAKSTQKRLDMMQARLKSEYLQSRLDYQLQRSAAKRLSMWQPSMASIQNQLSQQPIIPSIPKPTVAQLVAQMGQQIDFKQVGRMFIDDLSYIPKDLRAVGRIYKNLFRNIGAEVMAEVRKNRAPSAMKGLVRTILNPLTLVEKGLGSFSNTFGKTFSPSRIEYLARALGGTAPLMKYRKTDPLTGEAMPPIEGFVNNLKAVVPRALMGVGSAIQKTNLFPNLKALLQTTYAPYLPTPLSGSLGRGGKLKTDQAAPTRTGMGGILDRNLARAGIAPSRVSTGRAEELSARLFANIGPSGFETMTNSVVKNILNLTNKLYSGTGRINSALETAGKVLFYSFGRVTGRLIQGSAILLTVVPDLGMNLAIAFKNLGKSLLGNIGGALKIIDTLAMTSGSQGAVKFAGKLRASATRGAAIASLQRDTSAIDLANLTVKQKLGALAGIITSAGVQFGVTSTRVAVQITGAMLQMSLKLVPFGSTIYKVGSAVVNAGASLQKLPAFMKNATSGATGLGSALAKLASASGKAAGGVIASGASKARAAILGVAPAADGTGGKKGLVGGVMGGVKGFAGGLKGSVMGGMGTAVSMLSYQFGMVGMIAGPVLTNIIQKIAMIPKVGGPVILLLAALVGAFFLLKKSTSAWAQYSDGAIQKFKMAWQKVKEIFGLILAPIIDFFASFLGGADKGGKSAEDLGKKIGNFADKVLLVLPKIKNFVEDNIVPVIRQIMSGIKPIVEAFVPAIQFIINIIKAVVSLFKGDFSNAWDKIKNAFGNLVSVVGKVLKGIIIILAPILKLIVTLFFAMVTAIVNILEQIPIFFVNSIRWMAKASTQLFFSGLVQPVIFIVDFILTAFSKLLQGLVNIAKMIAKTYINTWFGIAKGLLGLASKIPFVGGVFDKLKGYVQGAQNKVLDFVDSGADGINRLIGRLAGVGNALGDMAQTAQNKLMSGIDSIANWLTGKIGKASNFAAAGRNAINGFIDGMVKGGLIPEGLGKQLGKDVGKSFKDPSAAKAAGQAIANAVKEGMKSLQDSYFDAVIGNIGNAMSKIKTELSEILNKQKEDALKAYDDQIAGIEALAEAEERLTATEEYESNRRQRIKDRELQRDNYQKERALAIYEGRVDDARNLDLAELKNTDDFNKEISDMDKSRQKELQGQNRQDAIAIIQKNKDEAAKLFDEAIKEFEDYVEEVTKNGAISETQLTEQFTKIAAKAQEKSGAINTAFQTSLSALPNLIRTGLDPTTSDAGFFSTELGKLVEIAKTRFGISSGTGSNSESILGVTTSMLTSTSAGIPSVISTAFGSGGVIQTTYGTALTALNKYIMDKQDPTNPESLSAVYKKAITDANATMEQEALKAQRGIGSAFAAIVSTINEKVKALTIAEAVKRGLEEAKKAAEQGGKDIANALGGKGKKTLYFVRSRDGGAWQSVSKEEYSGKYGDNKKYQRYTQVIEAFKGGRMPYANGGPTFGPMHMGIPATLHGGEFVLRKSAVDKYGLDMLSQMNQGIYVPKVPKFNMPMSNYAKISGMNNAPQMSSSETTHNYNFYVDNFIGETEWFNSMMKEYNMKVVPANQKQAGLESRVIKTYNGINRGM